MTLEPNLDFSAIFLRLLHIKQFHQMIDSFSLFNAFRIVSIIILKGHDIHCSLCQYRF